jgi:hypothetical protein
LICFICFYAVFCIVSPAFAVNNLCASGFGATSPVANGTWTYTGVANGADYWTNGGLFLSYLSNGYGYYINFDKTQNGGNDENILYYPTTNRLVAINDTYQIYFGATLHAGDPGTVITPAGDIVDGSCIVPVYGCTDPEATNYDPDATVDDESCEYVTPPTGGLGDSLASSTPLFYETTGFDIMRVASSTNGLIKLFIGNGLAIIYQLRGWLVALVIIGTILLFSGKAFRFFRH